MDTLVIKRSEWLTPQLVKDFEELSHEDCTKDSNGECHPDCEGTYKYDPKLHCYTTNRYCCLGIYAKACGFTDDQMNYSLSPYELSYKFRYMENNTRKMNFDLLNTNQVEYFNRLLRENFDDSLVAMDMMKINDDLFMSLAEKESKLIELFAKIGITLSFED